MLVHSHLEYWAAMFPDKPAAGDGVADWSYGDLDRRANQVGHALRSLGIDDGDRFAVLAKNCLEWLAIYFGAFKIGAIPVPLNYRLAPREWIHLVNDSGSSVLIAQAQYVEAVESVRMEFGNLKHTLSFESATTWPSFQDVVTEQETSRPEAALLPDHELYQMYTSGTTGLPKGAVLTHAAVNANIVQINLPLGTVPGDEILTVMPLFHAGAAVASFLQLARGAHLNVMTEFDAATCVRKLDEDGIAAATFVPAMIQAMLVGVPDVADRPFEKLRFIFYGASPIAEETLRRAMEVFGCSFEQFYGLTETSAGLTLLHPEDHVRALAGEPHLLLSCGRPLVGTEIRIVDSDDGDVEVGNVGEIIAKGPQLMKGYWNCPDATEDALRGGWLYTGDAGYRDDEGFIYLSDRIKDMIVSGGENIYPREIEDVIFEMPQVADCAVIGVPDDRWGETVKAIVVLRIGEQLAEVDVIHWCRARLAGFKCPRSVDFIDELPRNATGKVLKGELRKHYWTGTARNVN